MHLKITTLLALATIASQATSGNANPLTMDLFNVDVNQFAKSLLPAKSIYTLSHDPNDVHFYFFSDSTNVNDTTEIIYNNAGSLEDSGFVPNRKTVFITHGFRSNLSSDMPQTLKNAFLAANANLGLNYNIVVVSWGNLSTPLPPELTASLYTLVTYNVPIVARRLADFILFLNQQNYLPLEQVYLIGHSLGSHVSGLTGRNIFLATGQKIPRITGLDPAGPNYFPPVPERNLMKENALFVDVIHTDVGTLGDFTDDGHADFYPNGGSLQPNCLQNDTSSLATLGRCSHWYSYKLYAASLTKNFPACPCNEALLSYTLGLCTTVCSNPVTLGFNCPTTASGEYYLKTTNPP